MYSLSLPPLPACPCTQSTLGPALLHALEEYPVYCVDLPSVLGDATVRNAEESLLRTLAEGRRNAPSVVYWPHVDRWWAATGTRHMRDTCTTLKRHVTAHA